MDWRVEQFQYPNEIVSFLKTIFEIYEIRARVGETNGIKFSVRTNEGNHNIPHIHAEYGEYQVSIAIETQDILAGNLPKKKHAMAQKWVLEHKEELLNKWKEITVSATYAMTKSALDFPD